MNKTKSSYPRTRLIADHLSLHWQLYLVAAALLLLFGGAILRDRLQQKGEAERLSWPEVEAIVVAADHQPFTTRGNKASAPRELIESHLTFRYHVGDKDWECSRFVEFPRDLLPEYEEVLHAGSPVPIHVSPKDPEEIWLGDTGTWIQAVKAAATGHS